MSREALEIYSKLEQREEELEIFKEYLEQLYLGINDNVEQYWGDFIEISTEMIAVLEELGHPDIKNNYQYKLMNPIVTESEFRDIIKELYSITVVYRNYYEENIRKCIICHKKVFYLPLSEEYHRKIKEYNVPKSRPETLNEEEYICPICGSMDRDRLIIAYLSRCEKLKKEGASIIQIAPSSTIENYLIHNYPNLKYHSADLYMEGVTFQVDLQDMNIIPDNNYDFIICSHVLEHIPDDRKAIKELFRILKPGGIGILLVPLDLNMIETDEEVGCSEEENWRRFGQGDHVRKYAKKDFVNRIQECGFNLECLGKEYFGDKVFKENGLTDTSILYLVKK